MTAPVLTDEQRRALEAQGGGPVAVLDAATQTEYVLIPAEVYRRVRALLSAEEFDVSETYPLQDRVADEAWSHPEDAAYDDYDLHRGKQ